jgi:hypothetical protein
MLARVVVVARDWRAIVTAAHFDDVRSDLTRLRAFLHGMPKGGDLHVHLSGAVYAERLIAWAAQDGLCVRRRDLSIVEPPCDSAQGTTPVSETLRNQAAFDQLINSLSMRFFVPSQATPSGHDQFFGTFARFGPASARHAADMTVDQLRQYQSEAVQYTELMVSFLSAKDRQALREAIRGQTDFAAMLESLRQHGLDRVVEDMRREIAEQIAEIDALLACDAERTRPGCAVDYRYIVQVGRNNPIEDIFVQVAAAAALVRTEPRVVALNLVQPEDYRIAREDYMRQMQVVAFLTPDIPVALHAGELWLGLVPPPDLDFHIRAAVETGGARRIGHGTSLGFEREMEDLLAEMRRRGVTIEIALSSSDLILGVRGKEHPLPTYLAAGVPVVLATDDAGVSRSNLTNEYFRAAHEHGLGYRELKRLARNALTYSFLPQPEKERELARFDRSSAEFERATAKQQPIPARLAAVIRAALLGRP